MVFEYALFMQYYITLLYFIIFWEMHEYIRISSLEHYVLLVVNITNLFFFLGFYVFTMTINYPYPYGADSSASLAKMELSRSLVDELERLSLKFPEDFSGTTFGIKNMRYETC